MAYGWIPDPPHKRGQRSSRQLFGASPAAPAMASLESYAAPPLDQTVTQSCTGCGTAQAIYVACAAMGKPLGFFPSPREIYALGRAVGRSPLADGTLPPLEDVGASPADVMSAISVFGVCASALGTKCDADAGNVNAEPQLGRLEAAALHLVTGEHRIDETGEDAIAQIAASIAAGYPVGIGAEITRSFENWTPSRGPMEAPTPDDPLVGGHWMAILSTRLMSDGRRSFGVINSWSGSYGRDGFVDVTEDWIKASAEDLYVFRVTVNS